MFGITHLFTVKIGFFLHAVGERPWHPFCKRKFKGSPFLMTRHPSGPNKFGKMGETFQVFCMRIVNIQMIGIYRSDHCYERRQLVKGTVIFIGLDHGVVAFIAQQQVGVVVIGNAAQKSIAIHMGLFQKMRRQGRRSGLAMGSGDAQSPAIGWETAPKHLSTLQNLVTVLPKEAKLGMIFRNCGCSHYQGGGRRLRKSKRYGCRIFRVMHLDALCLQLDASRAFPCGRNRPRLCPWCGNIVPSCSCRCRQFRQNKYGNSCKTLLYTFISLKISSAMRSAESCWASFRMFVLSWASLSG